MRKSQNRSHWKWLISLIAIIAIVTPYMVSVQSDEIYPTHGFYTWLLGGSLVSTTTVYQAYLPDTGKAVATWTRCQNQPEWCKGLPIRETTIETETPLAWYGMGEEGMR